MNSARNKILNMTVAAAGAAAWTAISTRTRSSERKRDEMNDDWGRLRARFADLAATSEDQADAQQWLDAIDEMDAIRPVTPQQIGNLFQSAAKVIENLAAHVEEQLRKPR